MGNVEDIFGKSWKYNWETDEESVEFINDQIWARSHDQNSKQATWYIKFYA